MILENVDIRDAFFTEIYNFGKKDRDVIFITDDLDAHILRKFKRDFSKQFINIGVAEQNMVDLAAGLSSCGKKVFIYGICNYVTMRCFEQIRFSVCSMNLPVKIIGVGPGFSFSFDASSHHGTNDLAVMRILPEIIILNPCDAISALRSAQIAYGTKSPIYIRIDKGVLPNIYQKTDNFNDGFKIVKQLSKINIVSTGYMTHQAIQIAEKLVKRGLKVGVVDLFKIKPVGGKFINEVVEKSKLMITLEENSRIGGIGTVISEIITDNNLPVRLKILGVEDKQFSAFGSREWFHKINKIDVKSVVSQILSFDAF